MTLLEVLNFILTNVSILLAHLDMPSDQALLEAPISTMALTDLPNEMLLCILLWAALNNLITSRLVSPLWKEAIDNIFSRTRSIGIFHHPKRRSALGYRRSMVRYDDSFAGTFATPLADNFRQNTFNVAKKEEHDHFIGIDCLQKLPGYFPNITEMVASANVLEVYPNLSKLLIRWAQTLKSFTLLDLPESDEDTEADYLDLVKAINSMVNLEELRLFNCETIEFDDLVMPTGLKKLSISNRDAHLMDVDRVVGQLGDQCTCLWLENVDVNAGTFSDNRLDDTLTHLDIGRLHFTDGNESRKQLLKHICKHFRNLTHLGINFCWDFHLVDMLAELAKLPSVEHLTIPFNIRPSDLLTDLSNLVPLPTVHYLHINLCMLYPLSLWDFMVVVRHSFPNLRRMTISVNDRNNYNFALLMLVYKVYASGYYRDKRHANLVIDMEKLVERPPHDLNDEQCLY